ncbi:hypothetical protein DVH24_024054 [Malus domestica]|uniref:Oleosin n=1 Tax=Malus domestica TaxID=3750 RepID=A0A498JFQ6_MALDO|nr:hypothetical protein DVH24_024054 [Malus domestica]
MADRHQNPTQTQQAPRPSPNNPTNSSIFLRKLQGHAPNSTQLFSFLTLLVFGVILLLLTGLTVTATVLGLVICTPIIIISSPIWVPLGAILVLTVGFFVFMCGFGAATVAGLSWMYRYFKGMHSPGSDRVDYARS